jgi:hypothetical protein
MIFSPEMVRALGDGRKTQTRRLLKPQPPKGAYFRAWNIGPNGNFGHFWRDPDEQYDIRLPAWRGDRLWVREAFHIDGTQVNYRADAPDASNPPGPWRPSIHMPRWASRLTLVVTDVRVQRVQDITEADARAEGAWPVLPGPNEMGLAGDGSYRDGFRDLWNRIHGAGAWDRNDWVAARAIDVHRRNILEMDG